MAIKPVDTSTNDFNLQSKKIALLLTIYERLSDRYRFRAKILDLCLLVTSITVCLATFVDSKVIEFFKIPSDKIFIVLGIGAFMLFAFSVCSLISDWKTQAAGFGRAANLLNKMKAESGEKSKADSQEEVKQLQIKAVEYAVIVNNLPKIPQKEFHKLKTLHKRRIELNRMTEIYPGSSVWLLRIVVNLRANLNVLLRKPVVNDSVEEVG
ncbi:MAG: hypothetical protein GXY86_04015 [Firmicutes bacterium]|nr:hypothetical protein [Bacillota bacterium]